MAFSVSHSFNLLYFRIAPYFHSNPYPHFTTLPKFLLSIPLRSRTHYVPSHNSCRLNGAVDLLQSFCPIKPSLLITSQPISQYQSRCSIS